jgi:hypothetical protein
MEQIITQRHLGIHAIEDQRSENARAAVCNHHSITCRSPSSYMSTPVNSFCLRRC